MQIYTTYKVKIKHYHHIFKETVKVYRHVVDYLIDVCMEQWEKLEKIQGQLNQQREVERLVHATKAAYAHGYARICRSETICYAMSNARLAKFGLLSAETYFVKMSS